LTLERLLLLRTALGERDTANRDPERIEHTFDTATVA
jgi:hypothetical protein